MSRARKATVVLVAVGAVLLTAAGALAVAGAKSGSYRGTTSENVSVTFKIKSGAISNFSTFLGYNGQCGQGGGPAYQAKASRIAIGPGGKFSKKVTLAFAPAHIKAPGRISGTAKGSSVHGTVVQYLHGKPNKCYTETFTASRAG